MHSILWADDDIDDLDLFCSVLREVAPETRVIPVHNGREALDYLKLARERGRMPCLVILDMNMPGLDGRETLILMKNNEDFRNIPTVVFTTSSSELDRLFCTRLGVEMLTKPVRVDVLRELSAKFLELCKGA